jgi:hypothetical protein
VSLAHSCMRSMNVGFVRSRSGDIACFADPDPSGASRSCHVRPAATPGISEVLGAYDPKSVNTERAQIRHWP